MRETNNASAQFQLSIVGSGNLVVGPNSTISFETGDYSPVTFYNGHLVKEALIPVTRSRASHSPSISRMLKASSSPVPFEDRGGLLKSLFEWVRQDTRLSLHIVGGVGGSGKTRLSVELCRQFSFEANPLWKTGFLSKTASSESILGLACAPVPRLVIVDYAETRRGQVADLLRACLTSTSPQQVRVVLLVRQATKYPGFTEDSRWRWLEAVRPNDENDDVLEELFEDATITILDDSPLTLNDREALFAFAFSAFALADGPSIQEDLDLDRDLYSQPLAIVMAGFLAARGETVPQNSTAMFEEILKHEVRYWYPIARDAGLNPNENEKDRPDELAELVALATLTDVANIAEAEACIKSLPIFNDAAAREVNRAQKWLTGLYPSDDSSVWGPLEPDRLGEHLVATRLARYPDVLEWALTPSRDPEQLVRPLTVIARAAGSDAEFRCVVSQTINDNIVGLTQRTINIANDPHQYDIPSILPDTLSGVIQSLSSEFEIENLRQVSNMLPGHNHLLSGFAAQVSATLVESYRTLAEANPAAYLPYLASSLNNLGNRLSDLGQREEALPPTQEAVDIRRVLAKANPAAYQPDLASSLNNLGNRLSDLGRRDEALSPTQEAVDIRRVLAEANPAAYLPDLAGSLNNLGAMLSELGQREEALPPTKEAVNLRRTLAETNPAAYLPDLASSLNNLGARLSGLGQREEALSPAQEAADLRRTLAKAYPAAYLPDLAGSLNNLGLMLSELGRRHDALPPTQEAKDIYLALAKANPAAYLPDLATSLNNLGLMLSELGQREDALPPTQEAADLRRVLAEANPAAYLPDLATSLNNLGAMLSELGLREKALPPTQETVEIRRGLAKAYPAVFLPALSRSLRLLEHILTALERDEAAQKIKQELEDIRQKLAELEHQDSEQNNNQDHEEQ